MIANTSGGERPSMFASTIIILTMLVGLVPLALGFGGIDRLRLAEILIPLFFGLSILDLCINTKNAGLFFPPRGNLHTLFLIAFMFVILMAFIRRPLLPSSLVGESGGGFKLYWGFVSCFLTYFIIVYWANRSEVAVERLMLILMYIVLTVTGLGMMQVLFGISIPGLDTPAWSVNYTAGSGGAAGSMRAPFLEVYAQIGFILALASVGCSGKVRLGLLAYFIICIYLGGGRATLVTTAGGLIVWFFLNRKYLLSFVLVLGACMSLVSMQLINQMVTSPQLKRLTQIGSLEESSEGRSHLFGYLIDEFLENPIIGTGYGKEYDLPYIRSGYRFVDTERLEHQVSLGSHTTHLQILKNLGITGYFPFIMIWLYPVYKLLGVAMARPGVYPAMLRRDAQMCIVFIGVMLVRMTVTGNGSEPRLYVFAAIMTGVISELVRHSVRKGPLLKRRLSDDSGDEKLESRFGSGAGRVRLQTPGNNHETARWRI